MADAHTALPYEFDLLYDIKTVEDLHGHLTGTRRMATSATDQELIELARTHGIALPDGLAAGLAATDDLAARHAELLELVQTIHEHVSVPADGMGVDSKYLSDITAEALRKNGVCPPSVK